jgi:hypothetical protein
MKPSSVRVSLPLNSTTTCGKVKRRATIDGRVAELRPLGEFAAWRAARAFGDHDLNSFFVRVDPLSPGAAPAPGQSVWLELR